MIKMNNGRVYLDTCIYRDNFDDRRGGRRWVSNADMARDVMNVIKSGKYTLVVSDHLKTQLQMQGYIDKFNEFLNDVRNNNNKIISLQKTPLDKANANKFCKKHPEVEFEDALHAEIAIRGKAKFLITQNIEDFYPYENCANKSISIMMPRHVER